MTTRAIEKDPSCRDDFDPRSLPPQAALERVQAGVRRIEGIERVPLRSALDRVLAADIHSGINVPAGVNSAMDGYAVNSADLPAADASARLQVLGTAWAGKPFQGGLKPGGCARIMTGALLPEGADTVIIQEDVEREGDAIVIDGKTRKGDNVRQAGEDLALGDLVLAQGRRLSPADLGLIASLGLAEVSVTRPLRVAFFSTGDELRSIGESLDGGGVYDSNRYTLHAMLSRVGADIMDLGVVRDDREALEEAFALAAGNADALITSGGVSVGEADYVREIIAKLGQVEFWKVAIKPGRPLAFGQVGGAIFFGLPGNPVSVMVTFYEFVLPALRKMAGEDDPGPLLLQARCESTLKKRPGRVEYQRGILRQDADGALKVAKTGAQGSGILRSMSQANCFIVLPLESEGAKPGDLVAAQPFSSLA